MNHAERLPSSFRDPSGFVFRGDGTLYRQVNRSFQAEYDRFIDSGLYQSLVDRELLIPYQEREVPAADPGSAYKVLEPQEIEFISYPYEWTFSQLKDAALLTLQLQRAALDRGQVLKDASAFNVQFWKGRPIWIDSLSFEPWRKGSPWDAYRQFCQHYLAPLALASYRDMRLDRWLRTFLDGVPVDLASRLLPLRSWLRFRLVTHLHLHARAQARSAGVRLESGHGPRSMSEAAMLGLAMDLEGAIRALDWDPARTAWSDYTETHNYSPASIQDKRRIVAEVLEHVRPTVVWDLGANTGEFSRLATGHGALTVAFDLDPGAVETNYRISRQGRDEHMLPLIMDLTNPTPALGWAQRERESLVERGPADMVMALALVHHLAIANNVPLPMISSFFAQLGRWLLIEFVPKDDPQVKRLLSTRRDIFQDYNSAGFQAAFADHFTTMRDEPIGNSARRLFLMQRRKN